jgi:hypothetical protein
VDRPDTDGEEKKIGSVETPAVEPSDIRAIPTPLPVARPSRAPLVLGGLGAILGLAALGVAGWSYLDGQREVLRLASEVAQLRVSLDLYARGSEPAEAVPAIDDTALTDLSERLSSLEQTVRACSRCNARSSRHARCRWG